jgi:hypothetical protein
MIRIVPATPAHAASIELRPGDAREIAAHGIDPATALRTSLARSLWADAYLADGPAGAEVAAILGCGMSCLLGGHHTPWLITGTPVDRHRKDFLRLTRARIGEMRRRYPLMVNYIHADYAESVRWARWLGFEVAPPEPMGPLGEKFVRITMETQHGR